MYPSSLLHTSHSLVFHFLSHLIQSQSQSQSQFHHHRFCIPLSPSLKHVLHPHCYGWLVCVGHLFGRTFLTCAS
ncbi:hypothetical protein RJT34_01924 [Clitoria ternatea]|uniref:Uncharacterized protein n=1 Tax=Clitoria ternatea TaxID=43366 RepID=A0AAN9KK00_CLITE